MRAKIKPLTTSFPEKTVVKKRRWTFSIRTRLFFIFSLRYKWKVEGFLTLFLFCPKGNEKLTWMNLSHNKFSEKSGENLGLGISKSEIVMLPWLPYNYIEDLLIDSPANHLKRKGPIRARSKSAQVANWKCVNCSLSTKLQWNGAKCVDVTEWHAAIPFPGPNVLLSSPEKGGECLGTRLL